MPAASLVSTSPTADIVTRSSRRNGVRDDGVAMGILGLAPRAVGVDVDRQRSTY
jgi:hypothetical protein